MDLRAKAGFAPSFLEVVQKEKAWHVLTDSESGAATSARMQSPVSFTPPGMRGSDSGFLSSRELLSNRDGVIWAAATVSLGQREISAVARSDLEPLFKNGALPHQSLLRGLVIIEGAAEGAR